MKTTERWGALLLLFGCIGLAAVCLAMPETEQAVVHGSHSTRGGDILIVDASQKQQPVDQRPSLTLLDSSGQYIRSTEERSESLRSVQDVAVADIISQAFGLSSLSESSGASRSVEFVKSSFFERPRCNLFLSVAGVSAHSVSANLGASSSALHSLISDNGAFELLSTSQPASPATMLTNMLTGKVPSSHGIVADQFLGYDGQVVDAHSSQAASSFSANVADLFGQTFGGSSMTISLSGEQRQAQASSLHDILRSQFPQWRQYTFYFDAELKQFVSSRPELSDLVQGQSMHKFMSAFVESGGSFEESSDAVILSHPAVSPTPVVFHKSDPKQGLLFAELRALFSLTDALLDDAQLQRLVSDDSPDALFVHLAGLAPLQNDRQHYTMAHRVLDSAVSQLLSSLNALYGRRLVTELVLLGRTPAPSADSSAALEAARQALLPYLAQPEHFAELLPHVYLDKRSHEWSPSRLTSLCHDLSGVLSAFPNVRVHCIGVSRPASLSPVSMLQADSQQVSLSAASNDTKVTFEQIEQYHITLWLVITLVVVLVAALLAMACCIDPAWDSLDRKRDSLLYGRINPGAESKKYL